MTTTKKEPTKKEDKYKNVDWKAQINKVSNFCKKKDFVVKFLECKYGCSHVSFEDREIYIHNRCTPERMFYCLLHELGHVLIHENQYSYSQNLGFAHNNFSKQSLTRKIAEVEEEFHAWQIGYKKAKHMRLKINKVEYEKFKASYLSTYMEWAIDRKIKNTVKLAVKKALKKKNNREQPQI